MTALVSTDFAQGVLRVTLQRPQSRNALSLALIAEIGATFAAWRDREDVVLAVLTGAGDKAFCAGGDLKELMGIRDEPAAAAFANSTRAALDQIRRFPVPVVAVVNGDALGGGAELSLACDIRVATANARIGFLQSSLGITTSWGGGSDLFRLLPSSRAIHLLATAEMLNAEQAHQFGLVDAVAPAGEAGAEFVNTYIARLAQRKPQVMRAIKALAIGHRFGASAAEQAATETAQFTTTWVHDDHWAAVAAMTKR
jgi:enoyl-CoA hydratase